MLCKSGNLCDAGRPQRLRLNVASLLHYFCRPTNGLRFRMARLGERHSVHMALRLRSTDLDAASEAVRHFLDVESLRRMAASPALQQPRYETGLSQFWLHGKTRFSKRCRRLACANGRMSRRMRRPTESLEKISVAKSRTVGLNSESQRRNGRRLILPGCVATTMGSQLCELPGNREFYADRQSP